MGATNSGIAYTPGWKRQDGASWESILKNSSVTTTSALDLGTAGSPVTILASPGTDSFWVIWEVEMMVNSSWMHVCFFDEGIAHSDNTMDSAVFATWNVKGSFVNTLKFPRGIKLTKGASLGVDRINKGSVTNCFLGIRATKVTTPD